MHEIEHKIWVNDYCFQNELSLMKDDTTLVVCQYYNNKRDKEGKAISKTYRKALELARDRAGDGRYKNYEFLIFKP